ncbi:hypothetical protein GCM10019059_42590 [Camelimonas fluminis]|uniref:Uncharacterized protein n=1 Tax=Camelimonas fluminis TaxID=1576911 RepID=A0ABV7UM47_9HYPH|nr:hypothetical protein [Camelimonas fluminis]GHE79565.1 hypothetical protein GCM10019059_42590 [Camelimonas fluminis]
MDQGPSKPTPDEKPYPDRAADSRTGNQSMHGTPRKLDPEQTDETGKDPPKGKPSQQEYLDVNRKERPGEADKEK